MRVRVQASQTASGALDGREYDPQAHHCVIADDTRCLGLGGVMGGEYSGCTGTTTDVFIESAWFEPSIIRTTGRETGIVSDARAICFERGVDTGSVLPGLELATPPDPRSVRRRGVRSLCGRRSAGRSRVRLPSIRCAWRALTGLGHLL